MNVIIAQSDIVTAYGWGIDALWNGLLSGKTAVQSSDRFANRGFATNQMALVPDLQVEPGASRSMAMLARSLSPLIGKLDPQTPLILATTVGEIEYIERAVFEENLDLIPGAGPQMLLGRIKHLLGLQGPAMVVSSACASSATALTRAAAMIHRGDATMALVVTCDVVSEFVYSGFSTLLSLGECPARPFDAERCGLTLGEAAGWALIGSDESPANDESIAILGWGNTTDAVHMTAPDRNAGGLSRAIAKACAMAGRETGDISFIAAHGTATIYNDAMELVAFRGAIREPVPIFSIKGAVGHTLATAGLAQILVAARALSLGVVPPTVGMSVPDSNALGWVHNTSVRLGEVPLALSTNSGFGGVNTAILLGMTSMPGVKAYKKAAEDGMPSGSLSPLPGGEGWGEGGGVEQRNELTHLDTLPPTRQRDIPVAQASRLCFPYKDTGETPVLRQRGEGTRTKAVSWFCSENCGVLESNGQSWMKPASQAGAASAAEMLALIGRPVKYFARMTAEARSCLAAASIAMKAAGWDAAGVGEIGILAAGYDGCLQADLAYFSDYVAGGTTLGRGNLFIYTLPTSAQGEVAIALSLTGPTMHVHGDADPVAALFRQAEQLLENREAGGVLALWSDRQAAICFAIDAGAPADTLADFRWDQNPLEMARSLAAKVSHP